MSLVDLVMPKLGESIMEATILKWYKQVGDTINLDETLLDIATDKVDSEVPSTVGGQIKEILFGVNDVVPIGAVIARIETDVTNIVHSSVNEVYQQSKPVSTSIPENSVDHNKTDIIPAQIPELITDEVPDEIPYTPTTIAPVSYNKIDINIPNTGGEVKFYSPLVLNIAQSEGIGLNELQLINGTGSQGRVSKKDILNYIAVRKGVSIPAPHIVPAPSPAPISSIPNTSLPIHHSNEQISTPVTEVASPVANAAVTNYISTKLNDPANVVLTGNTELVEMDRMRKLIAKHMVDSVQTSPHVTSFVEADVTNMVVWREKMKKEFEAKEGTKLTYTPIFLEGIATALEQFPIVNSSLQNDQIVYKKDINIGMATALPTGNLIVPVIKGANQLNIVGLSKAVNGLANAARNNQLKPTDTQGGTFTVTNVGTFGSIMGTPIINQPQVAILALGAIKKRAVVIETPLGDAIAIRHMMYLSMSYDHRIVDGAVGTQFLAAVVKAFESWDPNRL
jgi:2-oxoglutarate dehydrogenase E2 component (dihydrolipoamide succinyltransferase)